MASAAPDGGRVDASLDRAIDFLQHSQLPHGEFGTYASPDEAMREACVHDSSPFATSLILYSISHAGGPRVEEITTRALDFLQGEMEGPGLWRYWTAEHVRHRLLPPDLDDTCCISYILKRHGRALPDNRQILLANRNEAGAFYTWLAPRTDALSELVPDADEVMNPEGLIMVALLDRIDDVDCAVNANALLYLGEDEDTQGALAYLVGLVLDEKEAGCSRFYRDRLCFYYMLSRAYVEAVPSLAQVRPQVLARVVEAQGEDGSFGNALGTALAACTLLNLEGHGAELDRAIAYLLRTLREDGSWPRIPMYLGPAPFYGSEELTTGFCVEALARYRSVA